MESLRNTEKDTPDGASRRFAVGHTSANESPTCRRCDTPMVPGVSLSQTFVGGTPDFPSDEKASTFSAGGPGRLTNCMKCPDCGHSIGLHPATNIGE